MSCNLCHECGEASEADSCEKHRLRMVDVTTSLDEPFPAESGLVLTNAATVEPERVEFAWAGRIPLGKLSILAGLHGLGKSTLALELAARATRGQLEGDVNGPVNVFVASAEDGLADTIVPRLTAAGADLTRVSSMSMADQDGARSIVLPRDLGAIEEAIAREAAGLVIIDPLLAHLDGGVNAHRDHDVRRALAPLAKMAERTGSAVLSILHLNKTQTNEVYLKIGGSVGLQAAPRSVMLFGRAPGDPDGPTRVLCHDKCNVGPLTEGLLFRIEGRTIPASGGDISTSGLAWLGPAPEGITGRDLLGSSSPEDQSALGEAREWLRGELAAGPVDAATVMKAARDAGIAIGTLQRAKSDLRVKSGKDGFTAPWRWSLPSEGAQRTPEGSQTAKVAYLRALPAQKDLLSPEDTQDSGLERLRGLPCPDCHGVTGHTFDCPRLP